jgi:hypothetical protein
LNELAANFAGRGVHLFVFGSAAPQWPLAPAGADLDLGFEIRTEDPAQRAVVKRDLLRALDALPTIRPLDAVDFDEAAATFAAAVRHSIRPLPDGND